MPNYVHVPAEGNHEDSPTSVGAMGLYENYVLPRVVDAVCATRLLVPWRERTCAGLSGCIVEIGFGAGRNVPYYPDAVTTVYAVEPSTTSVAWAHRRHARSRVRIEHVGLDGSTVELGDESCDAALVTFTLCTVPDPLQVLDEVRRVLKPGGRLHFLEHGLAPDPAVATWQRRLDPIEQRLAGGCHLTRDARALVVEAGFTIEQLEQRYVRGPKPWGYLTLGAARRP